LEGKYGFLGCAGMLYHAAMLNIRNTDKPIATNTIVIYNKDGQIIRQLGRNM
jgi:hypothetical protein